MKQVLLLLLGWVLTSVVAQAVPKQYHLVGDYQGVELLARANSDDCLKEENGVFPSGSVIWSRLSRLQAGDRRVLIFIAFESGASFTGKTKDFPYHLVLEVDRDMKITGGFALMPFWSEPYGEELIACVVPGATVGEGVVLDARSFHALGGSGKIQIDYAGVLHL
jgi:hypothetical protein